MIYKSIFAHNISTDNGVSGSLIIILSFMIVIGIFYKLVNNKVDGGIFIVK